MYVLVLLRHGESQWNKENRFTGWADVDLTERGIQQAKDAGKYLKQEGYTFDIAFTSRLKRAIRTLWLTLDEMNLMWIPVWRAWELNERHYGALQGLNKAETAAKHGEEQVQIWRRSYDVPPPPVDKKSEHYPGNDDKYRDLKVDQLPLYETLKDTVDRVIPFWEEKILPRIKNKEKVLISAHGNSLRALVKYLDDLSEEEVLKLNIPTGLPLVYELDEELKPIRKYYLGDPEEVKKAIEEVENQGRAK